MKKMTDSWIGMRHYLEKEMLAECIKGRIRWDCTIFPGTLTASSFEIYVDGTLAKQFSMDTVVHAAGVNKRPADCRDMKRFWECYWAQKALPAAQRCEFDDEDFALALAEYRCVDAQEAIVSDDPVVRLFAILDRRIGRCTLERLAAEIRNQPEWLRPFFRLRMEAEGV